MGERLGPEAKAFFRRPSREEEAMRVAAEVGRKKPARSAARSTRRPDARPGANAGWTPPDFAGRTEVRIGASFVEEFVAGHSAADVLRELVQNEFDARGDRIDVVFGRDALTIVGNGRGVAPEGWTRLSVIVGTGRVVGGDGAEQVGRKRNGIGSKNFGLRSLFKFGDVIYVSSKGQTCVLDLRTLATGRVRDTAAPTKGVRLVVPYRTDRFERLEPFDVEREAEAFDAMAGGMLATLAKLALPGRPPGLREVRLRSERLDRTLVWTQTAEKVKSTVQDVRLVRRDGRLIDTAGRRRRQRDFAELEFATTIALPPQFSSRTCPSYFEAGDGLITIGISVPLKGDRPDADRVGHFHYPLQAPDAWTGCLIDVSAPFELDNDRSSLLPGDPWNEWLSREAAALTVRVLASDLTDRFGPAAFHAVRQTGPSTPETFAKEVGRLLASESCWPSRAPAPGRLRKATDLVLPDDPALDGHLSEARYLATPFAVDEVVAGMAEKAGARPFGPSSLVRLRCAGKDDKRLKTKVPPGVANIYFEHYDAVLREVARQVAMSSALSKVSRRLSPLNRDDLRMTSSTLSDAGELRPVGELVSVPSDVWDVCPVKPRDRLHRSLTGHRAIADLAEPFDEQRWMIGVAERVALGRTEPDEREALEARLLDPASRIAPRTLSAVRSVPTIRNSRGEWSRPADLAHLKGRVGQLLGLIVDLPPRAMTTVPSLLARFRVRISIRAEDLERFAAIVGSRRQDAEAFERLLIDNQKLVTAALAKRLAPLEFLRARSGQLAPPASLHLDTAANRLMIADDLIVAGPHEGLYRRLGVRAQPDAATILELIAAARERGEAPNRPDLLYPALVAALSKEGRSRTELEDEEVLWVANAYHAPGEVLVGTHIVRMLDGEVPVLRQTGPLAHAYLALGARAHPRDEHWRAFFERIHANWDQEAVPRPLARRLRAAYQQRGTAGLPNGCDAYECLLARNGLLYSLTELRQGKLVENDFPALAEALGDMSVSLGMVDVDDPTRPFFDRLGLRPLSEAAVTGAPEFGQDARSPFWFSDRHRASMLAMLSKPVFARAMHAVATRLRLAYAQFRPTALPALKQSLAALRTVAFHERISRIYTVAGKVVRVPDEVAIGSDRIGFVSPKTKLDFQQLAAQALAEIAGAANVAQARALSTSFLPLVLSRNDEELLVYLGRLGIETRGWGTATGPDEDRADLDHIGEELMQQVLDGIAEGSPSASDDPPRVPLPPPPPGPPPPPPPSPPAPAPLPPLPDVALDVEEPKETEVPPRPPGYGSGGGGGWTPRSGLEVERDRELGRRGEELVYRHELERVRSAGHPDPEAVVIWTSSTDQGADHDIRSVDEKGRTRWIEVKSTSGTDGRFDWSRKEFEKALRERDRYELWRVYDAASRHPVARCFRDPAHLLGLSRLRLELGTLRAAVENLK